MGLALVLGRAIGMSNAVDTLVNRLDTVVDLYRVGGSITNAEIIGVLEIMKLKLFMEAEDESDDIDEFD